MSLPVPSNRREAKKINVEGSKNTSAARNFVNAMNKLVKLPYLSTQIRLSVNLEQQYPNIVTDFRKYYGLGAPPDILKAYNAKSKLEKSLFIKDIVAISPYIQSLQPNTRTALNFGGTFASEFIGAYTAFTNNTTVKKELNDSLFEEASSTFETINSKNLDDANKIISDLIKKFKDNFGDREDAAVQSYRNKFDQYKKYIADANCAKDLLTAVNSDGKCHELSHECVYDSIEKFINKNVTFSDNDNDNEYNKAKLLTLIDMYQTLTAIKNKNFNIFEPIFWKSIVNTFSHEGEDDEINKIIAEGDLAKPDAEKIKNGLLTKWKEQYNDKNLEPKPYENPYMDSVLNNAFTTNINKLLGIIQEAEEEERRRIEAKEKQKAEEEAEHVRLAEEARKASEENLVDTTSRILNDEVKERLRLASEEEKRKKQAFEALKLAEEQIVTTIDDIMSKEDAERKRIQAEEERRIQAEDERKRKEAEESERKKKASEDELAATTADIMSEERVRKEAEEAERKRKEAEEAAERAKLAEEECKRKEAEDKLAATTVKIMSEEESNRIQAEEELEKDLISQTAKLLEQDKVALDKAMQEKAALEKAAQEDNAIVDATSKILDKEAADAAAALQREKQEQAALEKAAQEKAAQDNAIVDATSQIVTDEAASVAAAANAEATAAANAAATADNQIVSAVANVITNTDSQAILSKGYFNSSEIDGLLDGSMVININTLDEAAKTMVRSYKLIHDTLRLYPKMQIINNVNLADDVTNKYIQIYEKLVKRGFNVDATELIEDYQDILLDLYKRENDLYLPFKLEYRNIEDPVIRQFFTDVYEAYKTAVNPIPQDFDEYLIRDIIDYAAKEKLKPNAGAPVNPEFKSICGIDVQKQIIEDYKNSDETQLADQWKSCAKAVYDARIANAVAKTVDPSTVISNELRVAPRQDKGSVLSRSAPFNKTKDEVNIVNAVAKIINPPAETKSFFGRFWSSAKKDKPDKKLEDEVNTVKDIAQILQPVESTGINFLEKISNFTRIFSSKKAASRDSIVPLSSSPIDGTIDANSYARASESGPSEPGAGVGINRDSSSASHVSNADGDPVSPEAINLNVQPTTNECTNRVKIEWKNNSCYLDSLMVALFASPDKDKYAYFEDAFKHKIGDADNAKHLKTAFNEVFVKFKNNEQGTTDHYTLEKLRTAISNYDTPPQGSPNWTTDNRGCEEALAVMFKMNNNNNKFIYEYEDPLTLNEGHPLYYIQIQHQGLDLNKIPNEVTFTNKNFKLSAIIIYDNRREHFTCYYLCNNAWYYYDDHYTVDSTTRIQITPIVLNNNNTTIIDYVNEIYNEAKKQRFEVTNPVTKAKDTVEHIIYPVALIYDKNEPISP